MQPLSPRAAEATRRAWRDLGFFYVRDDARCEWRLTGSRQGLLAFADIAEAYSQNSAFGTPSEHKHIGPHGYLELQTSDEPNIGQHAICGTQRDIARLAALIRTRLRMSAPGTQVVIREEFAPTATYSLALDVRDDKFDPASADTQLAIS